MKLRYKIVLFFLFNFFIFILLNTTLNEPFLSKEPTFLTIAHILYRIYVYIYFLEQSVCEYAVISRQLALVINRKYLKQQFVQEQICGCLWPPVRLSVWVMK